MVYFSPAGFVNDESQNAQSNHSLSGEDAPSNCVEKTVDPSVPDPTESKLSKAILESPVKKQSRNRVRLAANFSFAPVTKL